MTQTFLFRFDGAKDNDPFFELARSEGHLVFAGVQMAIPRGWVPDFIEVAGGESDGYTITLIELEATESKALIGARKYLAEPSERVRRAFLDYLERVLRQCRRSGDSRVADLHLLYDTLMQNSQVPIFTAAALRRPPQVIERLPLIDQAGELKKAPNTSPPATGYLDDLDEAVRLSPRRHKAVARSLLILDAVVRGWDKSDASLRAWRNLRSQPLRREVEQRASDSPALLSLLIGQKLGVHLRINDVARELAAIWNQLHPGHSPATVLTALKAFMPINDTLNPNASVQEAFKEARRILSQHAA